MITVRIWFEKRNEASYISLLDMQRVMQRVLKRSSLPVWHTLGFNPHIYMTFTCPLSLGQESLCESVDVKTEAENPDFQAWQDKLNAIMPAGIHVFQVEPARDKASEIAYACYTISYPAAAQPRLEQYNGLCRKLCSQAPPFDDALEQMADIQRNHRVYPLWVQLLAYFLGCGMFSLFYGGSVRDGVCGGVCGMVICLCLALTSRLGANLFFKTIAAGAASAFVALAFTAVGVGQNADSIIIGALMALVPGIAFTNAMRDIMAGDMVAGISKAAEALLIGAAIALGTALALGLIQLLTGG